MTQTPTPFLTSAVAADMQQLKLAEARALLGVSRTTLWRFIRDGVIEAVGEGKLTRIPLASIRNYQERNKRSSNHAAR